MKTLKTLPKDILKLLLQHKAPLLLQNHLTLVYNVAIAIIEKLLQAWPTLPLNQKEILFGAATHDIGKVIHPNELYQAGNQHEASGYELLINSGVSENLARFTKTHGNWLAKNLAIEDLIVSLADKIWKGKRIDELEERLTKEVSTTMQLDYWEVYRKLDPIISEISIGADERLYFQNNL